MHLVRAVELGPVYIECLAGSFTQAYLQVPAGSTLTFVSVVPISPSVTVPHLVSVYTYPTHQRGKSPAYSRQLITQGYSWSNTALKVDAKWEGRFMITPDYEYTLHFEITDRSKVDSVFIIFALVEIEIDG